MTKSCVRCGGLDHDLCSLDGRAVILHAPRCRYCGADCLDGRSWDGGDLYACPACANARARTGYIGKHRVAEPSRVSRETVISRPSDNASESIQTRCPRMGEHAHGDLPTPCPQCYSLRVTSERLPKWQPDERWRPVNGS